MSYRVEYEASAWKQLMSLPGSVQDAECDAVERLELEPRPAGVTKLKEEAGRYRIRVGNYRVVYEIHDNVLMILVVKIGNRREVYKKGR